MPLNLWGDCLCVATYIINRTQSIQHDGLTPYQVLFKEVPTFQDLKVFGCLCFATVVPHHTDKFAPLAVKGVFVGYPFAKKDFKVMDFQTRHVFVS